MTPYDAINQIQNVRSPTGPMTRLFPINGKGEWGGEKRMKREICYRLRAISETYQLNATCRSCLDPHSNQPTVKKTS